MYDLNILALILLVNDNRRRFMLSGTDLCQRTKYVSQHTGRFAALHVSVLRDYYTWFFTLLHPSEVH